MRSGGRFGWWAAWSLASVFVGLCAPTTIDAHPAYLTAAQITVETNGEFHGEVRFDTLAYALNDTSARIGNEPMEELLAGSREALEARLNEAGKRFHNGMHVETDRGKSTLERVSFPDAERVLAWRDTVKPILPVVIPVEIAGRLPEGAHTVAFRFPSVLEQVILTVERPEEEPAAEAVEAGQLSAPLAVRLTAEAGKVGASSPMSRSATSPLADAQQARLSREEYLAVFVSLLLLTGSVIFALRKRPGDPT